MATISKSLQNAFKTFCKGRKMCNDSIHNMDKKYIWQILYMYPDKCNQKSLFRAQQFHWRNGERFRNGNIKLLAATFSGITIFTKKQLISEEEDHDVEERMEVENRYVVHYTLNEALIAL